jgi:sugar (pentulose or hexulose) kinase
MIDVIAIFDIGKTNKKVLLFNQDLSVVSQHEQSFDEIKDDDGVSCDDISKIENWMHQTIQNIIDEKKFNIKAINFATYGASLAYLDKDSKRLTPVYNYLKPMPTSVLEGFYERYGGVGEFCRKTASPASGMLNSGLQILWLKKTKPEIFAKVKHILHFPQYLSFCFTGEIVSEYTSIGCHTSMWDFDGKKYHIWLKDHGIELPVPISNSTTFPVQINGKSIPVGIGIHDSSSSLVPYFASTSDKFILMSTGTWCVSMNPFNEETLTDEQLSKDALCYLSVQQKPVKSSRIFLGHIHQVNAKRIADSFGVAEDFFKKVKINEVLLKSMMKGDKKFFKNGQPKDYVDNDINIKQFSSVEEAYHQMVVDLARLAMGGLDLITPKKNDTKSIFISGGFARNEIFVRLIATWMPGINVYTSEMDNSTALGAALSVWDKAFNNIPKSDLGLKEIHPIIY